MTPRLCKRKPIHFARAFNARGDASALCDPAPRLRAISQRREAWTLVRSAVTCAGCREALRQGAPPQSVRCPKNAHKLRTTRAA